MECGQGNDCTFCVTSWTVTKKVNRRKVFSTKAAQVFNYKAESDVKTGIIYSMCVKMALWYWIMNGITWHGALLYLYKVCGSLSLYKIINKRISWIKGFHRHFHSLCSRPRRWQSYIHSQQKKNGNFTCSTWSSDIYKEWRIYSVLTGSLIPAVPKKIHQLDFIHSHIKSVNLLGFKL